MSRRESKVEKYDSLSSGDSNEPKSKQKTKEVNNNEVDELSKELSEMGCIVDAVKRPPNICVETCVYDGEDSEPDTQLDENEEDAYSDEFEEDKSEEEDVAETSSVVEKSETKQSQPKLNESSVKLSKSHPSVFPSKPCSMSGRSGTSTGFGSTSIPRTRRVNMSFTNERLREIERHNNILLGKILSARNSTKSSIPRDPPVRRPVPPAALIRKNQQRKIDHDNLILLKKIQRAKSSSYSVRR